MKYVLGSVFFLIFFYRSVARLYAPEVVACPSHPLLRKAEGLDSEESSYLQGRSSLTSEAFEKFIRGLNIPDLDTASLFSNHSAARTKIGLAFSGGGLRSLFTGAGALSALDDRVVHPWCEDGANLGGLLQSTSYISGLSGGGWLIGSFIFNGMNPIPQMMESQSVWNFEASLLFGDHQRLLEANYEEMIEYDERLLDFGIDEDLVENKNFPLESTLNYYLELHEEVKLKQQAGFQTSLTDYWSRALSRKLIQAGSSYGTTWSDITGMEYFLNYSLPFPILLAVALEPGEHVNSKTSTIVEFTPFEFGSWTPTIGHFTKIKYLGSHIDAESQLIIQEDEELPDPACDNKHDLPGNTVEDNIPVPPVCFQGLDNAGFVMGTSSSLFNDVLYFYARHAMSTSKGSATRCFRNLLDRYGLLDNGYYRQFALYYKNPFYGIPKISNTYTRNETLYLADGGEDGQNLPLEPLFRPERQVDVVIAIDSTSDVNNYPNGSAIFRPTWRYYETELSKGVKYPMVPSELELAEQQDFPLPHLRKPIFLGCNLIQYDIADGEHLPPLLVYVPNSFYSAASNKSTMSMTYSSREVADTVQNGYNVMTMGNSTDWSKCVGCATLLREFQRSEMEINSFCKSCYAKYCIN